MIVAGGGDGSKNPKGWDNFQMTLRELWGTNRQPSISLAELKAVDNKSIGINTFLDFPNYQITARSITIHSLDI